LCHIADDKIEWRKAPISDAEIAEMRRFSRDVEFGPFFRDDPHRVRNYMPQCSENLLEKLIAAYLVCRGKA
jgi:hypothetical protein